MPKASRDRSLGTFGKQMKRFVRIFSVAIVAVAIAVAGTLLFVSFLAPSHALTVAVEQDGHPIEANLYRVIFVPDLFFLSLPTTTSQIYRWIGVSLPQKRIFVPIAVRTGWLGLHYIHRDQAHGVPLSSGKLDDSWSITADRTKIFAENASLQIEIQKK